MSSVINPSSPNQSVSNQDIGGEILSELDRLAHLVDCVAKKCTPNPELWDGTIRTKYYHRSREVRRAWRYSPLSCVWKSIREQLNGVESGKQQAVDFRQLKANIRKAMENPKTVQIHLQALLGPIRAQERRIENYILPSWTTAEPVDLENLENPEASSAAVGWKAEADPQPTATDPVIPAKLKRSLSPEVAATVIDLQLQELRGCKDLEKAGQLIGQIQAALTEINHPDKEKIEQEMDSLLFSILLKY